MYATGICVFFKLTSKVEKTNRMHYGSKAIQIFTKYLCNINIFSLA